MPDSWIMTLLDPLCFEFLIGAAVAYCLKSFRLPAALALGLCALGVVIFIAVMIWLSGFEGEAMSRNRVLAFGLPSGLIVLGVVGWEMASGGRIPGWLRRIGDASYTLYLAHFLVLLVLRRVFEAMGLFTDVSALSMAGFMGVGLVVSVMAALILYRLIERPLLRLARAPLAKRPVSRQR
jgi:peptidoglycan/LPS O-acetylase OafA/YrhL